MCVELSPARDQSSGCASWLNPTTGSQSIRRNRSYDASGSRRLGQLLKRLRFIRTQTQRTQVSNSEPSEPRIDWLTLQCENAENAFVDSTQRFLADESFEGFDAECKLPDGQ